MSERTTITIARKMGSGGAYVGQIIARRFGLKYVDREVLTLAAESLGVEEGAVEASRERLTPFWGRLFGALTLGPPDGTYTPPPVRTFTDEELFGRQVEAMRLIARREDCVILGHGGAHVLAPHPRMINFYFHAPLRHRVRRVMELYDVADGERARRLVEESDERRNRYFRQMTGRDWACADNYHLCIDTSLFPLDDLAERLVKFIERRIGAAPGPTGAH
jgi:cytidylate kinase